MGFPFLTSKTKTGDYFFGLFLKENKGIGCVLHKVNNKIVLVAKENFTYSDGWEHVTEDVDNILSSLESKTKCHLEKTIFFFFSHFIDENENAIKRPYSNKIKELVNALSLKAIGYIECNDAVSKFLTKYDKFPLTTILIEIDLTNLGIFVYKSGYKKFHKIISRTDSIIEDILSAFKLQQAGVLLPSRIVLYNSSNLSTESSKIISYQWNSDLFVQTPRVETMKEDDILQALVSIFESQICKSEPQSTHDTSTIENKLIMGFVIGEDIKNSNTENNSILQNNKNPETSLFNLLKNVNFSKKLNIQAFKNRFSFIRLILNRSLFFPLIGIIVLSISICSIEYFFHKARITVLIPSKILQQDITMQGQLESQSLDSISVSVSTVSAKLSETKTVSGKRDVGETAKGEITLYNFDDKEKLISKGTLIKLESFIFETVEDKNVPGATLANDASAKLPGKAKVSISANLIGSEYNLEKNKRFIVGDFPFSTVFAINESPFTGGTKSSLTTVSKQDIDDLKQSLVVKAKKNAQSVNVSTVVKNSDTLTDLSEVTLTNIISSKEIGEAGNSVTVSVTALTQYYSVSSNNLKKVIYNQLASSIPTGFHLDTNNIDYQIKKSIKTKNKFSFVISVKGKSLKNIDIKNIPITIRGKQKNQISQILKDKYNLSNYSAVILPDIPLINNTFPFFEKNISLISQDL